VSRIAIYIGIDAVDRLDADLNLRSHTTAGGGETGLNRPADLSDGERARLAAGRTPETLTMGDVKTAPDGTSTTTMYLPLYTAGQFDGFAALRFDLQGMLAAQVRKTGTANRLELRAGDKAAAVSGEAPAADAPFIGRAPVAFGSNMLELVGQGLRAHNDGADPAECRDLQRLLCCRRP
jgi:hypothetical protein